MQFTVLIEFLIPGLATTLLALALLPAGAIPQPPQGMPSGETATALLLLAVSYPVGILVNFLVFLIQRRFLTPRLHRRMLARYKSLGLDIVDAGSRLFNLNKSEPLKVNKPEEVRRLFNLVRAFVAARNIDRMNTIILFQEGLQRFSRGMLLPLVLAVAFVLRERMPGWQVLTGVFAVLFVLACLLLRYSVGNEEEYIVNLFAILRSQEQSNEGGAGAVAGQQFDRPANPALNRTAGAAG